MYWIGLAGEAIVEQKKGQTQVESDFFAVANGYVSITPIGMDVTNYDILDTLQTHIIQQDHVENM